MRRWLALAGVLVMSCTSANVPERPPGPTVGATAAMPAASSSAAPTATASAATPSPAPLGTPTPAPTSTVDPRTTALTADLDEACAAARPYPVLPLAELTVLADGRSAQEFVQFVQRSRCLLVASARGAGPSEIALISNYRDVAIFWVDNGWWRASVQPLMLPRVLDDRVVRGARELTIGICPCGSGGDIGFAVLRIEGSVLTPLAIVRTGTSHVSATRLGDDLIHVVGRGGDGRPVAWTANCCMPGHRQWLYERRGAAFVLVAERQPYDPHYVAGLFFGGLKAGRTDALSDIASPEALAAAKPVFATPLDVMPSSAYLPLGAKYLDSRTTEELMTWAVIPNEFRSSPTSPSFFFSFGLHPPTTGAVQLIGDAYVEFRRRDTGGWYVAKFELRP